MKSHNSIGALLVAAGLLVLSTAANAQTAQSSTAGSSGRLWGTTSSVSGSDSSSMHSQDGNAAAQVNAARLGFLVGNGTSWSITAIGSQTIVSTTVVGDNNSTNVNATQTSSNTGTITNTGTISSSTSTSP